MTTITENDLKELKELMILQNQKIDKVANDVSEIKLNQVKLEAELKGELKSLEGELKGELKAINIRLDSYKPAVDKIPDLAEKVGELKNWKQIAIIVFTAAITSLAWILRQGKL